MGQTNFYRIGIGIGRPESRESSVIAKYVLSKMNANEKQRIENTAGPIKATLLEILDGYEEFK
jgi:PTH1 family peptidyl-tRNA hydrolase